MLPKIAFFEIVPQVQLVWKLINDYCEVFKSTIRGRYDRKLQKYISQNDITGGAQIRQIFNEFLLDYHLTSITSTMEDRVGLVANSVSITSTMEDLCGTCRK